MINEDDILRLIEGNREIKEEVSPPAEEIVVSPVSPPRRDVPTPLRRRRGRPAGHKLSAETKAQISKAKMGVKRHPKVCQAISDGVTRRITGAPMEILREVDLNNITPYFSNRYMNVFISNPVDGERGWYMRQHVVIVEKLLDRKMTSEEDIHHINLDPCDNRIENLAILSRRDHIRLHKILKRIVKLSDIQEDIYNGIYQDFKAGAL